MSIRIMSKVWEYADAEGSELLLLLALADMANDDGECWPGIDRLAKKIRLENRQTSTLLAKLKEKGFIESKRRFGTSNIYKINDCAPKCMTDDHAAECSTIMQSSASSSCSPVHTNHKLTTSKTSDIGAPKKPRSPSEQPSKKPTTPAADMRPMVEAIAHVTGDDPKLNYSVLARESKALITAGYTPAQVLETFGPGCAWYKKDWRGKKGARPDTFQVRKEIAKLINDVSDTRPPEVGNLAPVFNDTKSATRQKSQFEKEYGL